MKFSTTNANQQIVINPKSGKPRKTKANPGQTLCNIVGVAVSNDMKEFITKRCLELDVNKADYIRSLIYKEMIQS